MNDKLNAEDHARLNEFSSLIAGLREKLGTQIVGQEEIVTQVMAAILSEGHCLIIGVPGLAKTLLVRSIAELLTLDFSRIQFTPDLMPSDIIGASLLQDDQAGNRGFHFLRGPIFSNVILADEINRTPPKTQAALMEAMEERQVTAAGENLTLERPFFVLATQNPIEQEGTYNLPEAQLDRFIFSIRVGYPAEEEELEIMKRTRAPESIELSPVLSEQDIIRIQALVPEVPAADHVYRFALKLVRRSRPEEPGSPGYIRDSLTFGAGPRAAQYLMTAAKARAILRGRFHVNLADIARVAVPVLSHRLITNFNAAAEGITPQSLVNRLLEELTRENTKD